MNTDDAKRFDMMSWDQLGDDAWKKQEKST